MNIGVILLQAKKLPEARRKAWKKSSLKPETSFII